MACSSDDFAGRYVQGSLDEPGRQAFEDHYFACDECFELVRTLEAARAGLAAEARPRRLSTGRALALAASLAGAALAATVLLRGGNGPTQPADSSASSGGVPAQAATGAPPAAAIGSPIAATLDLSRLSSFEPPEVLPLLTRGSGQPGTLATGVARYLARDWPGAVRHLRQAPSAPRTRLLLGVAELLAGEREAGCATLETLAVSGTQPYADEARYYRAKGLLQGGDLDGARAELRRIAEGGSPRRAEAEQLLSDLARVAGSATGR